MKKLRIRNWDRWQSYRRDRGQPPWIKVHRCLMRDLEWVAMSDAQRGQLVAIWLLAADHDGVIPASPEIVQKLCFMTDPPDLKFFMDQGFIEDGDIVTPERRQPDANVSRQSRGEAETETETEYSANADSELSLSERLWGEGLKTLGKLAGEPPNKMRSMLGKWRQNHGEQETLDAIIRAEKEAVSEPVAWITAALRGKGKAGREDRFRGAV